MMKEVTIPWEPIPIFEPEGTLSAADAAWRWELCAGSGYAYWFRMVIARWKSQALLHFATNAIGLQTSLSGRPAS